MAITAPGIRPASMSAFSVSEIRASRSLERPTSSGLARGSRSSANAALQTSKQNEAVTNRSEAMDASRLWALGPLSFVREAYGNAHRETSLAPYSFAWADRGQAG